MKYLSLKYWAYALTASLTFFNFASATPRVSPYVLPLKRRECGKLLEFQECVHITNMRPIEKVLEDCLSLKYVYSSKNYIERTADSGNLYIRLSNTKPNTKIYQNLKKYFRDLKRDKQYLTLGNDISLLVRTGLPLNGILQLIKIMQAANPFSGYILAIDPNITNAGISVSSENGYFIASAPGGMIEIKNFIDSLHKHKSMKQSPHKVDKILKSNVPILIHIKHNRIAGIIKQRDTDAIEKISFKKMAKPQCAKDRPANAIPQQRRESPNQHLQEHSNSSRISNIKCNH